MENTNLWTPWEWKEFTHPANPKEEPQGTTIMSCAGHYVTHQFNIRPMKERQEIASAIVTAINSTYGKGIDPSSVPELLEALRGTNEAIEHFREMREKQADAAVMHNCEYIITLSLNKAKSAIDKAIIK